MPYLKQEDRQGVDAMGMGPTSKAGHLNYAITKTCLDYVQSHDSSAYQTLNDVLGALEGAKLELYRRYGVNLENHKKALNGDVYPGDL